MPLSQTILLDINPKERHGQAMAMWGAGIMVGPIVGPTLGGWLTDTFNWRWVFFINLPVGILAFLGMLPPICRASQSGCAASISSASPCCRSASARCS